MSPRRLTESLALRLMVPLAVTVTVVLGLHAAFDIRSLTSQFEGVLQTDARRFSDLIRRATYDGMLEDRLDEVQVLMERMAEGPGVEAIRVYDKEGSVVLSAQPPEIGSRAGLEERPCLGCHGPGLPVSEAAAESAALLTTVSGRRVLRHLSALENEPACATAPCHAHDEDGALLGVLDVELSLDPMDRAHRAMRNQLIGTTLILLLITGIVAAVFVRRLVHEPASRLYEATQRIASGDLETRIPVAGRHELARLAESFNRMTRDLAAARREVEEWSQRLEEKVVERTDELHRTQRQVLHMEKMASLGKLAATVAHELNNPISGILTYARLVERELGDYALPAESREELLRYLSLIQKECSRSGEVVRNLLLFARRDSAEMGPADIGDVVERSLMLVRHHAEMHDIELASEIVIENRDIHADAGQLQQALVALCVNAVEAMVEAGEGGELRVRVEGDPETVLIQVRDTGVGIPAEVQPQIFEPFFSTKDNESGVGLGLAVVYGIVQRHGGEIGVESAVGQGATFEIRLPRRPPAGEPASHPVVSERGSGQEETS